MTVKELIKELQELPEDTIVVCWDPIAGEYTEKTAFTWYHDDGDIRRQYYAEIMVD